jgi:hypothetical protein
MRKVVKSYGYSCELIEEDTQLIIRIDTGQHSVKFEEYIVTKSQFQRALTSQEDAEQVVIEEMKKDIKKNPPKPWPEGKNPFL